jgi:hypothetical protein
MAKVMNLNEEFQDYLKRNLVGPELQKIWYSSFSRSEMEDYIFLHKRYLEVPELDISEVTKLQFMDISNLIMLRTSLVNDKEAYLERFIKGGGVSFLLRLLASYLETTINEQTAAALFEILQCCKLSMEKFEGIREFLCTYGATTSVARCLMYEYKPLAILVLDLLGVCCFWEDSTSKVVKGFEERAKLCNEEPFEHLYKGLNAENMEITSGVMELVVRLFTDPMDSYCRSLVRRNLNKNTIKIKCEEVLRAAKYLPARERQALDPFLSSSENSPLAKTRVPVPVTTKQPFAFGGEESPYISGSNRPLVPPMDYAQLPTVKNPQLHCYTPYLLKVLFLHKEIMYRHVFRLSPTHLFQYNDSDTKQEKVYNMTDIEKVTVPTYSPYSEARYLLQLHFRPEKVLSNSNEQKRNAKKEPLQHTRVLVLGFEHSTDQLEWNNAIQYYVNLLKVPEETYYFYKKYLFHRAIFKNRKQDDTTVFNDHGEHPFYTHCLNSFSALYSNFLEILNYEKFKSKELYEFDMNNVDEVFNKLYEELLVMNHENFFLNVLQNCLSFTLQSFEKKKRNEKGWIQLIEITNRLVEATKEPAEGDEDADEESPHDEEFANIVDLPSLEEIKTKIQLKKSKSNEKSVSSEVNYDFIAGVNEEGGDNNNSNTDSDRGMDRESLYKQINKLAKLSVMQKQEIQALKSKVGGGTGTGEGGGAGGGEVSVVMDGKPKQGRFGSHGETSSEEGSDYSDESDEEGGHHRHRRAKGKIAELASSLEGELAKDKEKNRDKEGRERSDTNEEPDLTKYLGLFGELSDADIVAKMKADGFSEDEVKDFLEDKANGKLEAVAAMKGGAGMAGTKFEKYSKMVKMRMPEGAVRAKMKMDNIPDTEIDSFLSGKLAGISSPVDKKPAEETTAAEEEKPVDYKPLASAETEKYDKMKKRGIPEGAIRQKMAMDGVTADQIEVFFNPSYVPGSLAAKKKEKKVEDAGPHFKNLHWDRFMVSGDAVKNTMFGDVGNVDMSDVLDKDEIALLTNMFINQYTLKKKDDKPFQESQGTQNIVVSLLDSKQYINLAIAVNKLPEKKVFIESMLECNSKISKDDLDRLIFVLPDGEVVQNIISYPRYSELDKINKFLFSCYDTIPYFQERCETLQTIYNYQENLIEFKGLLGLYNDTHADITKIIPQVKEIFLTIFKIGMLMQTGKPIVEGAGGGAPGGGGGIALSQSAVSAAGVTLSAISKLYSCKSNTGDANNLLHFILMYISNHYPKDEAGKNEKYKFTAEELLNVFDSQASLRATVVDPYDKFIRIAGQLLKDFQRLENDLRNVKQRKEANLKAIAEKKGDERKLKLYDIAHDFLLKRLSEFFGENKPYYDTIAKETKAVAAKFDSLLEKFGEKYVQDEEDDQPANPAEGDEEAAPANKNEIETKIKRFLEKLVEFIERYEFARKGCGLLIKELQKARGEDVDEENKETRPRKLSKESQELKNKKHKHRDRTKEKTATHHRSRKRGKGVSAVTAAEDSNFRFSMPRNKTGPGRIGGAVNQYYQARESTIGECR